MINLMNKIMKAEDINILLDKEYNLKYIKLYNKKVSFSDRTFNELISNNIISNRNYIGDSVVYDTDKNDNLAISKFAIIDNIAYLSWIWICEPIRNKGYGKKLLHQTIEYIKSKYNIDTMYTIPKSDAAKHIFNKHKFKPSDINGFLEKEL